MPTETHSARTIFLDALERAAPEERSQFVEAACAGDDELHREVVRLLAAHGDLNSFMGHPAAAGLAGSVDLPEGEQIGAMIGRYKLLEQIGEGGMGVVYVAEQTEPVRRRVALKIIKPGMDTRQVIARFEAERQALAMMDHPNIAKVLDAGTTEASRPYFVMELVRGTPITDYCDQARLDPRARLELFTTVCHAVQHAHQKGVIHRDLKPTNVLVTLHDGQPVAKVIDFGVAKAINQQLTERTIYTAFSEMIGTPLYMSPEQAELSGLDVDTRSDVYSLGVLLYELLTGQTPFESDTLIKAGLDEVRRMIREVEPACPSHRISTLGASAGFTVSHLRSIDQRQLSHLLHGELDWIVMKALEKDRNRRYESPCSLAEDIQRYLNDLPIIARAPSVLLRARKWRRRHPLMATTIFATSILLATLLAGVYWHNRQLADALEVSDELRTAALGRERSLRQELLNNDLTAARQAALIGNCEEVNRLLNRHRPTAVGDDGGFALRYLRGFCPQPMRTFIGHKADLLTADVSPDDKFLASGDRGGEIKIWNLTTGQEIKSLRYGSQEICSVRFSPDGRFLASAGQDETIRIWDVATWSEIARFSEHTRTVCSVAWSPDSKWLASGGRDSQVHIWDVEAAKLYKTLEPHDDVVRFVTWSPNGRWLASANGSRGMWLFNTSTWQRDHISPPLEEDSGILAAAFSPDSRYLAYGGYDRQVRVFDMESMTEFAQTKGAGTVWSMSFTLDGELITGLGDGGVRLFDLWLEKRQLNSLRQGIGETGKVRSVICAGSGQLLVTVSGEARTVKVWNLSRVRGHRLIDGVATSIGILPTHDLFMCMDEGTRQHLHLRDLADGSIKATLPFAVRLEAPVPVISRRHKLLAVLGTDGRVCLWDAAAWKPRRYLPLTQFPVRQLAFSHDGEWLAAACEQGVVGAWNISTGTWQDLKRYQWDLWGKVAFSPTECLLAIAAGYDDKITLWRLDRGKRIAEFPAVRDIRALTIASNGKVLAAADFGNTVTLWDLPGGSPLGVLRGHAGPVDAIAFSPDGSTLVSGSQDGTVRLWNVESRRELFPITQHERAPTWIGFLSDDRLGVIRSPGDEVLIFDATGN